MYRIMADKQRQVTIDDFGCCTSLSRHTAKLKRSSMERREKRVELVAVKAGRSQLASL